MLDSPRPLKIRITGLWTPISNPKPGFFQHRLLSGSFLADPSFEVVRYNADHPRESLPGQLDVTDTLHVNLQVPPLNPGEPRDVTAELHLGC